MVILVTIFLFIILTVVGGFNLGSVFGAYIDGKPIDETTGEPITEDEYQERIGRKN